MRSLAILIFRRLFNLIDLLFSKELLLCAIEKSVAN